MERYVRDSLTGLTVQFRSV